MEYYKRKPSLFFSGDPAFADAGYGSSKTSEEVNRMIVNYKARNLEITEAMKEYCEKRLAKFDKLIGIEKATVSMSCIRDRQRIEITIPYNGVVIRGEEEGYDMYASIDKVTEKLESQIHKYRTRLIKKGRVAKELPVAEEPQWLEDDAPVKTKTFTTKPMTTEEAVMQMNLLGHDFFVFVNFDTGKVNVLYRRADKDYGLLIPEN